jgi:HAD superfamily hydrolase (TIGR01490 family)
MTVRPSNAAFFDVDETLIAAKSMFDFLRFWTARCGDDTGYERVVSRLRDMAERGVPRAVTNREYYRYFRGVPLTELRAAGADWYARYRRRPDAFVTATLDELHRHRARRTTIVLVSGSFPACLEPLAEELHADLVLCTEPLVGPDGRLTGEVRQPMIGAAKAAAVRDVIAARGLVAADCYGYGDHVSDLEMLLQVGHPVVVGTDPVLLEHAGRHGWRRLPADAGPVAVDDTGPAPARTGTAAVDAAPDRPVDVTPDEHVDPTPAQPVGTAVPRTAT